MQWLAVEESDRRGDSAPNSSEQRAFIHHRGTWWNDSNRERRRRLRGEQRSGEAGCNHGGELERHRRDGVAQWRGNPVASQSPRPERRRRF